MYGCRRGAPLSCRCGGGQDGINRPYFVPFLTLLSRQCLVLPMGSDTDHRLGFQHVHGSYHAPLGRCGPLPLACLYRPLTHWPFLWVMNLGLQIDGCCAGRRLREAGRRGGTAQCRARHDGPQPSRAAVSTWRVSVRLPRPVPSRRLRRRLQGQTRVSRHRRAAGDTTRQLFLMCAAGLKRTPPCVALSVVSVFNTGHRVAFPHCRPVRRATHVLRGV